MLLSIVALLAVVLLAACAAPVAAPQAQAPAGEAAAPAAGGSEFHSAWPYSAPPVGHFNTFVTNGFLADGPYQILMEPPLFMYMWADASWKPVAGQEVTQVDDTTVRVTLQPDAVWSDGSKFTSQDVVDTFAIYRLLNTAAWDANTPGHLVDVKAVDDATVDFILSEPSNTIGRRFLRESYMHPSSVYGEWAKRAQDLVAAGKTNADTEWQDLLKEFSEFRPEDQVVLGAYKIDPASITESQMTLNKVPTSFMAPMVKFDKIVNFNGETPTVTPLVLAGDVDYATHGFPPATEKQYIEQGIRIIRAPTYFGPAIFFNHKVQPLDKKEVRQAMAYVIDRNEVGTVSLGESGKAAKYMTGYFDEFTPTWVDEETMGKLNLYDPDLAKAEELLTGLGWTRNDGGQWQDETGKAIEFELIAPAEFADWSAAAENVAEQLTKFGIKTTYRGVTFTQQPLDVDDGKFQLAIRGWGTGNPHPVFSYNQNLRVHNAAASGLGDVSKPGMGFNMVQTTDALGEVDFAALYEAAGAGNDEAAQKEAVSQMALAFNELLPVLPLFERYGNNAAPDIRVTGWPADGDPVFSNGVYNDPFAIVLMLDGVLEPKTAQ
jgi:peptide/nickel transport system substrate-binding protein